MTTSSEANDILLYPLNEYMRFDCAYETFENGTIEQTYDGKNHWRYYDNGTLLSYGILINNKRIYNKCEDKWIPEGRYIEFYKNGNLRIYQERKNGVNHGIAIHWNKDGSIREKKKYANDVVVKDYMND